MVLARAIASSRATISRRGLTKSNRSAGLPVAWTRWGPFFASAPVCSRRNYSDDRRELLNALSSLAESQRLASEGTPDQRREALAKIEEAQKLISGASPLQRRQALLMLQKELSSIDARQVQSLARNIDPTTGAVGTDVGRNDGEGRTAADLAEEEAGADGTHHEESEESSGSPVAEGLGLENAEDIEPQAAKTPIMEESDRAETLGTSSNTEAIDSVPLSPPKDEEASASSIAENMVQGNVEDPVSRTAKSPTIEEFHNAKTTLENTPSTAAVNASSGTLVSKMPPVDDKSHSVEQWLAKAETSAPAKPAFTFTKHKAGPRPTKPLGTGSAMRRLDIRLDKRDSKERLPPADPNDKRKWEVIQPGHEQYPELSKEDQARLVILRRTQDLALVRRIDKVWLRNACTCEACVDRATGWKNFNITAVPEDVYISTMEFNKDTGALEAQWENDFLTGSTHTSVYPAELFEYFYRPPYRARQKVDGKISAQMHMLWNNEKLKQHQFRYLDYSHWQARGDEYILALESFHTQGVLIVKGTQDVSLETVASKVGPLRNTPNGLSWEVGHDPQPRLPSTAYTGMALPPETYSPWLLNMPRLLFLQCLENSVEGGEQILVDGIKTVYDMEEFDAGNAQILRTYPYRFNFVSNRGEGPGDSKSVDTVYRNRRPTHTPMPYGSMILRLCQKAMEPDPLYDSGSTAAYTGARRALKAWVNRTLDPNNTHVIKMEKGDCLVIDAWRILLGRKAFDTESGFRRFRAGVIDHDEWQNCVNPLDTRSAENRGELFGQEPYGTQVWRLAGLNPADRPERQEKKDTLQPFVRKPLRAGAIPPIDPGQ